MLLNLPIIAAGTITDSLGRDWNPLDHPRGRDGKFIHTFKRIRGFLHSTDTEPWMTGEVTQINDDGSIRVRVQNTVDPSLAAEYVGNEVDITPDLAESLNEKATLDSVTSPDSPKPGDGLAKYELNEETMSDFLTRSGIGLGNNSNNLKDWVAAVQGYKSGSKWKMTSRYKYWTALYGKSVSGDGREKSDQDYRDLLADLDVDPGITDDTPDGMSGLKWLGDQESASRSPDIGKPDSVEWLNEEAPVTEGAVREATLRNSDVRLAWFDDGTQGFINPDGSIDKWDKNSGSIIEEAHYRSDDQAKSINQVELAPKAEIAPEPTPPPEPEELDDELLFDDSVDVEEFDSEFNASEFDDIRAEISLSNSEYGEDYASSIGATAQSLEEGNIDYQEAYDQIYGVVRELWEEAEDSDDESLATLGNDLFSTANRLLTDEGDFDDDEQVATLPDSDGVQDTPNSDTVDVNSPGGDNDGQQEPEQVGGPGSNDLEAGPDSGDTTQEEAGQEGDPSAEAGEVGPDWDSYAVISGNSVSQEESDALYSYIGLGYEDINNDLRNDSFGTNKNRIEAIDAIMDRSTLLQPLTTYRGIEADDDMLDQLVEGATITDKGFVSTSISKQIADSFGLGSVLIQFDLPEGTNAIDVQHSMNQPKDEGELEIILPRGSSFEIVSVDESNQNYKKVLTVRLVDTPEEAEVPETKTEEPSVPNADWLNGPDYAPGSNTPDNPDYNPLLDEDGNHIQIKGKGPENWNFIPASDKGPYPSLDAFANLDVDAGTVDMGNAIWAYSNGNSSVNGALRTGNATEYAQEQINQIDQLMQISSTTEDMQVNRSVLGNNDDDFMIALLNAEVGDTIHDSAYSGTTTKEYSAGLPYGNVNAERRVHLKVNVPGGSRAVYVRQAHTRLSDKSGLKNGFESELLLDREGSFEIVSIEPGTDGKTDLVMTVNYHEKDWSDDGAESPGIPNSAVGDDNGEPDTIEVGGEAPSTEDSEQDSQPNTNSGPTASTNPLDGVVTAEVSYSDDPEHQFVILEDTGVSGDGWLSNPGGPTIWGKFGAAGVLIRHVDNDGEERFLVVRRGAIEAGNAGQWQLAGGAIDELENDWNGAARELWEELGASKEYIANMKAVGNINFQHPTVDWHYNNLAADVTEKFDPVVDGYETDQAAWLTRDEIKELNLHPGLAGNIDALFSTFDQYDADNSPDGADVDVTDPVQPLNTESWKAVGGQQGTNEGGTFQDENGNKYYVKRGKYDDHAREEAAAAALYEAAGIEVAPQILATTPFDGALGTASPIIPNSKQDLYAHLNDPEYLAKIREGFMVDAWLANYDVAGLSYENIMTDENGNPVRIDQGGALSTRAQGIAKVEGGNKPWGDTVPEIEQLIDGTHPSSAAIFKGITEDEMRESAKLVVSVTPDRIDKIIDSLGFSGKVDPEKLKATLKARREYIADRFLLPLPEDPDVDSNDPDLPDNSPSPSPDPTPDVETDLTPKQQKGQFDEQGYYVHDAFNPADIDGGGSAKDTVESLGIKILGQNDDGTLRLQGSGQSFDDLYDKMNWVAQASLYDQLKPVPKPTSDDQEPTTAPSAPSATGPVMADYDLSDTSNMFDEEGPFRFNSTTGEVLRPGDLVTGADGKEFIIVKFESNNTGAVVQDITGKKYGRKLSKLNKVVDDTLPEPPAPEPEPEPTPDVVPTGETYGGDSYIKKSDGLWYVQTWDGSYEALSPSDSAYIQGKYDESNVEPLEEWEKAILNGDPAPISDPEPSGYDVASGLSSVNDIPKTIGAVKKQFPQFSTVQATAYRNAGYALDDAGSEPVGSKEWHKAVDRAIFLLGKVSPASDQKLAEVKLWRAAALATVAQPDTTPKTPANEKYGIPSSYKGIPENPVKIWKHQGPPGLPDTYASQDQDGTLREHYSLGEYYTADPTMEATYNAGFGWEEVPQTGDADSPAIPLLPAHLTPLPSNTIAVWKHGYTSNNNEDTYFFQTSDGSMHYVDEYGVHDSTVTPQELNEVVAMSPNIYAKIYEDESFVSSSQQSVTSQTLPNGFSQPPQDAKNIWVHQSGNIYAVESSNGAISYYYKDGSVEPVSSTPPSDYYNSSNIWDKFAPEADTNTDPEDTPAPAASSTPTKIGKNLPGADGKPIYVGDSVQSVTDGKKFTVVKFEANGTGVVVVDENGKKSGRKLKKLRSLEAQVDPVETPVKKDLPKDPDSPYFEQPKPVEPEKPAQLAEPWVSDEWMEQADANYQKRMKDKNPSWVSKPLSESSTYSQFLKVRDEGNTAELLTLLNQGRITQEMHDSALQQISSRQYAQLGIQQQYKDDLAKWREEVKAWRAANGLPNIELKGMTGGNVKTFSDSQGVSYFNENYVPGSLNPSGKLSPKARDGVSAQKHSNISGNHVNGLRSLGAESLDDTVLESKIDSYTLMNIKGLDQAMLESPPLKEDTIFIRTFNAAALIDPDTGKPYDPNSYSKLSSAVGSIQHDWGFAEAVPAATSAGGSPGYTIGQIVMNLRVPAGTRGVWTDRYADGFPNQGERGFILDRGLAYYIHSVNYDSITARWMIDAEVISKDDVSYDEYGHFVNQNPFFD